MKNVQKPYIIVPFLIEQPTWGGHYIAEKKGWGDKSETAGKKIGQSYELYGKSKLALSVTSTDDAAFGPLVENTLDISAFKEDRPFPLIKFTQAKGNSFQLHVKPNETNAKWKPKAESWYFFEPGKITFGLKTGKELAEYRGACLKIEKEMGEISRRTTSGELTLLEAKEMANKLILNENPWQYVNVHLTAPGDVVDLSGGGLHHSWEEDAVNCPLGNVIYEIQQDVMDPESTLRSFDQGKLKDDGTIREITIEDYFRYIDTDQARNTLSIEKHEDGKLFDTPYYSLDRLRVDGEKRMESVSSFHHLFVNKGRIEIEDKAGNGITVGTGHSCFIPKGLSYRIAPEGTAEVLLTYLR